MSNYAQFIGQYRALNVVRNEVGGLSIARRTSDRIHSERTVDIEAVWLGHDEHTRADTNLRVSLARMAGTHMQANWLINPFDGQLECENPAILNGFEAARTEGLVGISAIKAYLQLPKQYQQRVGWVIEDKCQGVDRYAGLLPEVAVIQELAKAGHDPSAAECLALFDHTLRNGQNPQSLAT